MKNEQIKNLSFEVPKDIRIQVYKDARKHYEAPKLLYRGKHIQGLCIVLPMILWGLVDMCNLAPDGKIWDYQHTTIAFPELTNEVISDIERIETDLIRIQYLQTWISELEK